MKAIFSSRRLFALGFCVLIVTNVFVLWGVYANRAGETDARVELTERELSLPYYDPGENSSVSLNLQWRVLGKESDGYDYGYYGHWRNPEWFTEQKLIALGFDVAEYKNFREDLKKFREPVPKEVFVVLEIDSGLHATAIERAVRALEKARDQLAGKPEDKDLESKVKNTEQQLEREKYENSRLFAIDAGLDAKSLRAKYSDRSRYIITKGVVEPSRTYKKGEEEVIGYISRLSIEAIYVPLEQRKILDTIRKEKKTYDKVSMAPRYSVQLAYGTRLEPWITAVDKFMRIQIDPNRLK